MPPPPEPKAAPPPPTKLEMTFKPDVTNYYPEQARRDGQEGRVLIKICVDTSGKVDTAEVATSSGNRTARRGSGQMGKAFRFKPATQEGKPVSTCPTLPVKFELHAAAE